MGAMSQMWNLWHGCHRKSEGCQHCYVFRRDEEFEKDSSIVTKTSTFNLPIHRDRNGNWKVPSGTLMWTCFTSDFFIEEGDAWREDAWLMIQHRLLQEAYGHDSAGVSGKQMKYNLSKLHEYRRLS